MKSKSVRLQIKSAFTILEAVVSVALIGIATAAAFQVMKVVSMLRWLQKVIPMDMDQAALHRDITRDVL